MKLVLSIITLLATSVVYGATDLQKVLKDLDAHIESSDIYVQTKKDRINQIRNRLKGADEQKSYELNYALFEEFQSFKYDSAYFYANRCLELAEGMNDNDKKVRSRCALVFCYLSSGLFLEAFNEMQKINANDISTDIKTEYYSICNRLYYDASDFNDTEKWSNEYTRIGTLYADSLMAIVPKDSYEHLFARAQSEIKHWHYRECIDLYKQLLLEYSVDDHSKAIIHSSLGGAYKALQQKDSSMIYLAKAAIYDIVSATKETTALYRLAEMLCETNDQERAYTYIHTALEDAEFYNARHRKLSINPILPIIEKTRLEDITKQRNLMAIISILCAFIVITLASVSVLFRKQHKKLERKSRQLIEANRIKEEYIGHSFYINSEFIAEVEELYDTINKKIVARQFEDLRSLSKQSKINKKRESMYESFDKCFLKIFPTFIHEYASMFAEGQVDPNATSLTSEMRIFALIRLGINDSERIAKFLNYSVHTIYTYKTRVKTKSIVDNEEFEKRIKAVEIGT